MARRARQIEHQTMVESPSRGVSAAGEATGAVVIMILIVVGLVGWAGYSATTFLYRVAVELLGWRWTSSLLLAIPGTFLLILLYGVAGRMVAWVAVAWSEARQAMLQAGYVQPNADGLLPVAKGFLDSDAGQQAAVQLALADKRAQWVVADVPQSLTYSPRYSNKQEGGGAEPAQLATVPAVPARGFWELYSAGRLPDKGFLMGYTLSDGEVITADWSKLYSALIGGLSGSGKSTLVRSVLAQSALQGGRFIVLDPHYGAGEESLGASLQPLRHLMLTDVAGNDGQMREALAYVREIGQRRLSGRDQSREPVILVVDETTALLQRSASADLLADVLGEISQETRKVGVYGLCIGQNFDGRIMDTTVRNSFVSFISCRARRDVARTMTGDPEFGKAAQGLTTGQAVWMTPQGEMWTIAFPNCTQRDLEMVATHTQKSAQMTHGGTAPITPGTTGANVVPVAYRVAAVEPPLEPVRMARIATMRSDGIGVSEIIRVVFGVQNKGRAWQAARADLQRAMDYLEAKNL